MEIRSMGCTVHNPDRITGINSFTYQLHSRSVIGMKGES